MSLENDIKVVAVKSKIGLAGEQNYIAMSENVILINLKMPELE